MNVIVILHTLKAKPVIFNLVVKAYKLSNASSGKNCSNHLVETPQCEDEESKNPSGIVIFLRLKDQKFCVKCCNQIFKNNNFTVSKIKIKDRARTRKNSKFNPLTFASTLAFHW